MTHTQIVPDKSTALSSWFDEFVCSIRSEQMQLESGIAVDEKKAFWKNIIENNQLEVARMSREGSNMLIIPNLITDYLQAVKDNKILSLSFQLSDSKILVWAIVNDDDDETMDQLFLAEAAINNKYGDFGFHISITIMEKSDKCSIPPQFQQFI